VFGYYLTLALRSLQRTPALTALMVLAIGVGIGISMTALAIFRTAAGDPIPAKSAQLFAPQMEICRANCTQGGFLTDDGIPVHLTYRDVRALMRLNATGKQAAMYSTAMTLTPPNPQLYSLQLEARATGADFFSMFEVPFQYGAPWGRREDAAHAAVVVISRALNDRLFGGTNSVGRTLRLNTEEYRIVAVIDTWQPVPRFYDLSPSQFSGGDALFIPFTHAVDLQLPPNSGLGCSKRGPLTLSLSLLQFSLASECAWSQLWVELPTAAAVRRYRQLLTAYAAEQHTAGRFRWTPRVRLRDVRQLLRALNVVPAEVRVAVIVAFALLIACLFNAMSIIMARFLPRTGDVSVRRATGATRTAIFLQSLIEVALIGVIGGLLGLMLAGLGLQVSRLLLPINELELVRFDRADVAIAAALSILTTILAGLYPTWRMSRVQPALQLKVQ
jgi:putative ABC transport system permease protein